MSFSKRTLSIVTVVLILAVLGGGIYLRLRPENAEAEETGAEADTTEAVGPTSASQQFSTDIPQPVEGAEVVRDTLWISVTAAGVAEANRRVTLKAQVDGVVQSLPVRENTPVGQGRAVLQIDSTELALAVADARAALLQAEAEFQRRTLFDDQIEDEQVRRQREAVARAGSGLDAAEVRLRQEQLRLARSTVRAPFGGRIADLLVVPGQHVTAGTDLMTVVDANPIEVEVQVLEAELATLSEGRRATITFAGFPGQTFEGRVASLNPVVDPETRTGRVTVVLSNPTGLIRPGMYARVTIEAEALPDRLLVPRRAILERGNRTMLFAFETEEEGGRTGQAMWRYVTTGRENERLVEIVPSEEGTVEPGEVVLVDGHHYLAHGVDVRLVEDVAAAGGRPGG